MRSVWRFAAVVFIATLFGPAAMAQPPGPAPAGTLVQIKAKGSVSLPPDVMGIGAGVVTTGTTAAQALERNNQLAARLIEAVKKSGIAIRQLKTSRLSVNPRFAEPARLNEEATQIIGYVASNGLDIELAEVAQAGQLVSLLFEAGANKVSGPYFDLKDSAPARRRAEQAAIREAQAQADNYAAALGMRVVRVTRIYDQEFRDMGDTSIVVMGSRISPTPIEPGEVTIEATLHAEFLLETK